MVYFPFMHFYRLLIALVFALPAQAQIRGTIWDIENIYKVPAYKTLSADSALGIVYEGLSYKGHAQPVFAYYASPGTIAGNRSLDHDLPAVVLVHGGGGTAFREWALMWARKGYAAIAMDLRGNGPGKKHMDNGFEEPGGETPYFTITPALDEQWMFQAVADVILAHNLLRSMPGVDGSRTAITGISWGGIITCLMAGVDDRYRVAVPVYGCGFLLENSSMRKGLLLLDSAQRQTWVQQYDPSRYIGKTRMPVLFVNGTNDGHFYLDSYAKTYGLVKDHYLSIKPGLKHSHHAGWANDEIFAFINSYLAHTPSLPRVQVTFRYKNDVRARVSSAVPLTAAFLHYTTDTATALKDKVWQSVKADLRGREVRATLPPVGTKMWFLSVTDERGLQSSGEIQFVQ